MICKMICIKRTLFLPRQGGIVRLLDYLHHIVFLQIPILAIDHKPNNTEYRHGLDHRLWRGLAVPGTIPGIKSKQIIALIVKESLFSG